MRRVQRIAYRTVQLAGPPFASEALEAFTDVTAEEEVPSDPGAVAARITDEDSRELGRCGALTGSRVQTARPTLDMRRGSDGRSI